MNYIIFIIPFLFYEVITSKIDVKHPNEWVLLQQCGAFPPRDMSIGFQFDDKLWLSNGFYHENKNYRDLYCSEDGVSWRTVSKNTPYTMYAPIQVKDGKAWAVAGSVWNSVNGTDWIKVLDHTPWENVVGYLVVFNDHLVYLSPTAVWKSKDGIKWESDPIPFQMEPRTGALIVFNGQLLYIGGGEPYSPGEPPEYTGAIRTISKVWASSDGKSWSLLTDLPGWSPRLWPSVVVHQSKLWLFGGYDPILKNFGDLWSTFDGVHWKQEYPASNLRPDARHASTLYSTDQGIVLVAGNTHPVQNDVWLYKRYIHIRFMGKNLVLSPDDSYSRQAYMIFHRLSTVVKNLY